MLAQWLSGLVTGIGHCWFGFGQQLPDGREPCPAAAIGEEAIMANAVKTVGQAVQQEATDELVRIERHQAGRIAMTKIAPAESHARLISADQAAVGDSDTVGVAAETCGKGRDGAFAPNQIELILQRRTVRGTSSQFKAGASTITAGMGEEDGICISRRWHEGSIAAVFRVNPDSCESWWYDRFAARGLYCAVDGQFHFVGDIMADSEIHDAGFHQHS